MAFIEIVSKPENVLSLAPEDRPVGKIEFLEIADDNPNAFKLVHQVSYHKEDLLRVLGQSGVMCLTTLPARYTKIEYDLEGIETEGDTDLGQCLAGVTQIETDEGSPNAGEPILPDGLKMGIGAFVAPSCRPVRDTSGGTALKYYLVE